MLELDRCRLNFHDLRFQFANKELPFFVRRSFRQVELVKLGLEKQDLSLDPNYLHLHDNAFGRGPHDQMLGYLGGRTHFPHGGCRRFKYLLRGWGLLFYTAKALGNLR